MSPRVIKTVALAGGTGALGSVILKELLAVKKFEVILLTRSAASSASKDVPAHVTTREVDYDSVESIFAALDGVDAMVDATSAPTTKTALNIVIAAAKAGVYRTILSSFGIDTSTSEIGTIGIFAIKTAAYEKAKEFAASSPSFTWTTVVTGCFLDWGLQYGTLDIDLSKREAKLWSDGEALTAVTTLQSIGRAVAGVLENLEATANRPVHVKSAVKSQKQLLDLATDAVAGTWKVETVNITELGTDAVNKIKAGTAGLPEIYWSIKYGIAIQKDVDRWESNEDNELLGVKLESDEEIKALMKDISGN